MAEMQQIQSKKAYMAKMKLCSSSANFFLGPAEISLHSAFFSQHSTVDMSFILDLNTYS